MNVLHLIAGDLNGGAARGAYWLHKGLLSLNQKSFILNNSRKDISEANIRNLIDSNFQKVRSYILPQIVSLPVRLYRERRQKIFSIGIDGYDITKYKEYEWADVIHLHWINGLVSINTLHKITKPIVWTLRDMWPMTGGCHYSMDCANFVNGCGFCPQLTSSIKWDISRLIYNYKKKKLPKQIKIVGISKWLTEMAKNSLVFKNYECITISNCVETSMFQPICKTHARQILNFPKNKKIVLCGSTNIEDFYKGFDLFLKSLLKLNRDVYHFVFFGSIRTNILKKYKICYTNLSYLTDTVSLRLAYSSADVFVAPSRMEAFGKTIVESMSCKTPVVCFDATGPKDIIDHKENGYKAIPFDPEDLANGINWVTSPHTNYKKLMVSAREKAIDAFDSKTIAQKYIKLYKSCLK